MFSFLKNGDIQNTMKTMTDNLSGLTSKDKDKIKYSLLNYSTIMRHNLNEGEAIFRNIRKLEAEIEEREIASLATGRGPSLAAQYAAGSFLYTGNDGSTRCDNASLALIMAKELAFLNRTIQMISLIACRYQEEQEDLEWGRGDDEYDNDDEESDNDDDGYGGCGDDHESDYIEDDSVPNVLQRSHSHDDLSYQDNRRGRRAPQNQLVATFLIASGRLRTNFNNLCELAGTYVVRVNAMTTMDHPHTTANREKQLDAENIVISDIYTYFEQFDAEHRNPVVWTFLELRDISIFAWRIMSMFAFSNLFRLTAGTEFTMYQQEDAIFSQGRDYRLQCDAAAEYQIPITTNSQVKEAV
jgi:hypothetical protein